VTGEARVAFYCFASPHPSGVPENVNAHGFVDPAMMPWIASGPFVAGHQVDAGMRLLDLRAIRGGEPAAMVMESGIAHSDRFNRGASEPSPGDRAEASGRQRVPDDFHITTCPGLSAARAPKQ